MSPARRPEFRAVRSSWRVSQPSRSTHDSVLLAPILGQRTRTTPGPRHGSHPTRRDVLALYFAASPPSAGGRCLRVQALAAIAAKRCN
jgi:hypothetical protein